MQTVVFDTKPYDREPFQHASAGLGMEWRFMDWRLSRAGLRRRGRPFFPDTA